VIAWLRRSREPNGAVRGKLSGTYSPTGEGKFFFTMMAAFAELERDIIHERTMAGLAAARAQRGRRAAAAGGQL
jgi:DNA invertase Pin-like site-specific DNA recombinase